MSEWVTLRAGCKVNLFLDITALRPDGRHDLYSLFWSLQEPHDTLRVRVIENVVERVVERVVEVGPGAPSDVRLSCAAPEVDPLNNTVVRAWTAFANATGEAPSIEIELLKGIPSGAGLGGASADAAVLLNWLNARAVQPLSPEKLLSVAESVGADVPFFLANRPALGTGVGEILRPCPQAKGYAGLWIVLVCPPVSVQTGAAFRAFDAAVFGTGSDKEAADGPEKMAEPPRSVLSALTNHASARKNAVSEEASGLSPLTGAGLRVHEIRNSLEFVVFAMYPELARYKSLLVREGAAAAGMSGSGSTVFGLFRDVGLARCAALAATEAGAQTWVQQLAWPLGDSAQ